VTPIADDWGETQNDCQPFSYGAFGIYQWSAACDKLIGGWALYEQEYKDLRTKFINGPFSANIVNDLIVAWSEQIRAATQEADEGHSDALSVQEWENNLYEFMDQLEFARNK